MRVSFKIDSMADMKFSGILLFGTLEKDCIIGFARHLHFLFEEGEFALRKSARGLTRV